ncbi:hypothetical protein [Neptunicella marina]|uniref:Sulfotransferase family protein n=1 Tax=Neptunicella marina TaxID=2125989 RepID=A0A8J6IR54_9ALTE|nr:hypothetical protein [Neptunicella marina]MBC3764929.1 hypothetical protein [Neptunicella marina]
MSSNNKLPFYLCTGFHRSGTSLIAQTLSDNGMKMGDELMGASFSNPLGHVEDLPIVRLHDKIFEINGVDWRYHDNAPLVKPNWLSNYIAHYVNEKRSNAQLKGVKDPRALFFLKDWQLALKSNIRFIFVYRHWSTSCQSLFKRHSQHLVNSTQDIHANKLNFSFWQTPELAFDMWYASNKRMLEFYLDHPDKCLMIAQDALVSANSIVQGAGQKIGLSPENLKCKNFKSNLLMDEAYQSTLDMAPASKRLKLDALWDKLQQAADVNATDVPNIIDDRITVSPKHFADTASRHPITQPFPNFDIRSLTIDEAFGFLVRIPPHRFDNALLVSLLNRATINVEQLNTLAKVAHKAESYVITKLAKMRAMQKCSDTFVVADWSLYTKDDQNWSLLKRKDLPKGNPFSLRPLSELAAKRQEIVEWLKQSETSLLEQLNRLQKDKLEESISAILLYREINNIGFYDELINLAVKNDLWLLTEYALLLRLKQKVEQPAYIKLADLYRSNRLYDLALSVLDVAQKLENNIAVITRIADCSYEQGNVEQASKQIAFAEKINPNHAMLRRVKAKFEIITPDKSEFVSQPALSQLCTPQNGHYESVVELMRTDYRLGRKADHEYRQNAFVLRNNRLWLKKGLERVTPQAQLNLFNNIYRHWLKLFPECFLRTDLNLEQTSVKALFHSIKAEATNAILLIDVTDIDSLISIDALVSGCSFARVYLFTEHNLHQTLMQQFNLPDFVHVIAYQTATTLSEKLIEELGVIDREYIICRLTTSACPGELSKWRSQQWYYLLGNDDWTNEYLSEFQENEKLGVILPPLDPHIVNAESKQLTELLQSNNLPFVGEMFWFRSQSLKSIDSVTINDNEVDGFISGKLSALIRKNGFDIRFCHQLVHRPLSR